MWWPSTCTDGRAATLSRLLALLAALLFASSAMTQNLESALMPGKVIQGHAKYEDDCSKCHVRFDRGAQSGLCQQCHQAVAIDVRAKRGHHGRIQSVPCSRCHSDHKGRTAQVVQLVENQFDHKLTDFPLRGKHLGMRCAQCHKAGIKHRDAPTLCSACHARDDPHKGRLGSKCESCHREQSWKDASFDHATTRLPLRGRHQKVACAECHDDKQYANAQADCQSCHRKDDAHKGGFGAKCGDCHTEQGWKPSSFDHDRATRFPLRGRHAGAKCETCHRTSIATARLSQDCVACHRSDDVHKESLGARCQRCHNERGWKSAAFDHGKDTRFPLRGRHRTITCQSCHVGSVTEKIGGACIDCHRKEDVHRGVLGEKCQQCHTEAKWKETSFDHDRDTRFALLDRHRKTQCRQCHQDQRYAVKPPNDCYGCHRADDRHRGQLGTDCAACHDARTWNQAKFDHAKSRFPLSGRHVKVPCKDCHSTSAFKDASVECVSCHAKQDVHKERLGSRCGQCHLAEAWKTVKFDHDRDTRYKLEGAHAKKPCTACHTKPMQENVSVPTACVQCHRSDDVHFGSYGTRCDDCHRPTHWRQVDKRAVDKFLSEKRR